MLEVTNYLFWSRSSTCLEGKYPQCCGKRNWGEKLQVPLRTKGSFLFWGCSKSLKVILVGEQFVLTRRRLIWHWCLEYIGWEKQLLGIYFGVHVSTVSEDVNEDSGRGRSQGIKKRPLPDGVMVADCRDIFIILCFISLFLYEIGSPEVG